jgi:hypothetical protein
MIAKLKIKNEHKTFPSISIFELGLVFTEANILVDVFSLD